MFTVADLSAVWVIGDLFEKDFSKVRIGSKASITTPAYPEKIYEGHITYIDPRVDPQTRTAKVRVEVTNPEVQLRIGMYVDVSLATLEDVQMPAVPREAVQSIGSDQIVYLRLWEWKDTSRSEQ